MQGVKEDLARDCEAYTCGEEPSIIELHNAPRLDEWTVAVLRRGKEFILVVRGTVTGHPGFPEHASISTSAVVWFDRHHRWVRAHRRLYRLGQQAGEEVPLDGIVTDDEG